ncbi:MAG TPA: carboxypeptidase-like regulatory domain-containing protein [Candidatus Acidoferrales bacterium]
MTLRAICVLSLGWLVCAWALPLAAAPNTGAISGVVVDGAGTPQMGAAVLISSEKIAASMPLRLLTNDLGHFSSASLPAGMYTIHVTLAGFLPAVEQHVRVSQDQATLLEIVVDSVFSSFEKLRRQPDQTISSDDWTWVLRSSAATRPVLRWQDDDTTMVAAASAGAGDDAPSDEPLRGRVELTSGADRAGSVASLANAPATAIVYDLGVGEQGHLVVAGQFSYDGVDNSSGFAGEWLPDGQAGAGPVTTFLVRESRIGPNGSVFRGMRLTEDDQLALGDRVSVRYGAKFIIAGFNGTTAAVRPHGEVAVQIAKAWRASIILATDPWADPASGDGAVESTLDTLDAFPNLMLHDGRPVLENGDHQEIALVHSLSKRADITASFFHDRSTHTAVIGRGAVSNPDFLQAYLSESFAYDGGSTGSMGGRVVYRENLSKNLKTTVVYSYAGALAPNGGSDTAALRDELATRYRQSLAAGISGKSRHLGTQFSASYKWLDGQAVSQQDPYGESLYHMDPYLSLEVRQPLPSVFPGHMQVEANVGNLLEQGYVPVATRDGYVVLIPSYRYFRGGLSVQF